jgi:micrococcal nuclease
MYNLYNYRANVISVYDGDTITVDIDLGMGVWIRKQKIRLASINAPEVRGKEKEEGIKSREWLRDKILGKEIVLETIKDKKGKYGRWLGNIWLEEDYEYININELIVEEGFAIEEEY